MTGDLAHPTNSQIGPKALGQRVTPGEPRESGVTIAVVDPDENTRAVLMGHVKTMHVDVAAYDSDASFAKAPGRHEPTVILLGPSVPPEVVIERVEVLLKSRRDYGAVMLVFDLSAEMVRSAFRAGVDDVVSVSADETELFGAISRSVSRVRAHLEAVQHPATEAPPQPSAPAGRVVTVFGAKGGTGKSVVAINLAVALARQMTEPVVLVDANPQFGDVAIMLQLRPEHTIAEAVLAGDRLDGALLEGLLLRHKPSGLLVLAAPSDPESTEEIGGSDLLNILTILRDRRACVVVDTSPRIEESTLVALQAADDIVMLTSLDVMSLKNSRWSLQALDALGIQRSKVKLVLNRANTQGGLTRADAERAMQMKVDVALPSDSVVAESVNRGVPVMLSAPTSKFAHCIDDLARALKARSSAVLFPTSPPA